VHQGLFSPLDKGCFRFLNSLVEKSSFWQNFWAMANHKMADWLEDIIFIGFFYWQIRVSPKEERIRKTAEILFLIFYSAFIILIANELLFRVILHIKRDSPTLVMDTFTNLSEKITWLKVKFKSPKSFPGDHATTALIFMASFVYLARKHLHILCSAICYGIFLCLPRLIAGAHWLSDILVGSGSIMALFFAWAFYTPLAEKSIQKLENALLYLRGRSHAK
jgi:membrane-associated phospholipid phosphatase